MQPNSLISVIIPTYNASLFISQCLETILAQSYTNLEIIVVDDGSEDDTVQRVKQYPVNLIRQENKGAAAARNAGIIAATGDYLHFMDVDDLINLDFYKKMLEAIVSVEADMACAGYVHERLPAFTSIVTEKFLFVNTDDKMRFANVFHQGNVWKYLYRTAFIKERKLLFDADLRNAHDKVFAIQAVYFSNKIISVPGAVYYYKDRSNSLVTSLSWKKRLIRNRSIAKANEFCKKFAGEHQIKVLSAPRYITYHYALLGILPLVKRRVYNSGRVRWYLLGVFIFQMKQRPISRKVIS
ncbi:MAG: glycosyltransferase [Cyclobacteriaceae bacterium]|nr:glycosyltransferase [Cyclobacteriaceae bacterium]